MFSFSLALSFHPLGKSESERLILSFLGKDVEFLKERKKIPLSLSLYLFFTHSASPTAILTLNFFRFFFPWKNFTILSYSSVKHLCACIIIPTHSHGWQDECTLGFKLRLTRFLSFCMLPFSFFSQPPRLHFHYVSRCKKWSILIDSREKNDSLNITSQPAMASINDVEQQGKHIRT